MNIESVMTHFVLPMRRRFTVPAGIDQQGFLEDLAEALSGYGHTQLEMAAQWFRDNRETRAFPTVAECRKVCERYPTEEQRSAARGFASRRAQGEADWQIQREREFAAYKLCRCGMGRQADREGWLPALVEFCTDNQRLPEGFEIGAVQAKARRSEDALAALIPVRPGPDDPPDQQFAKKKALYEACANWRKIMLDRAHEKVFGWLERQEGRLSPDQHHKAA